MKSNNNKREPNNLYAVLLCSLDPGSIVHNINIILSTVHSTICSPVIKVTVATVKRCFQGYELHCALLFSDSDKHYYRPNVSTKILIVLL